MHPLPTRRIQPLHPRVITAVINSLNIIKRLATIGIKVTSPRTEEVHGLPPVKMDRKAPAQLAGFLTRTVPWGGRIVPRMWETRGWGTLGMLVRFGKEKETYPADDSFVSASVDECD
jgi:hypothetical protein